MSCHWTTEKHGHTNTKDMKPSEIKIHRRNNQRASRKKLLNSTTPMTIGQQLSFIRKARGMSTAKIEEDFDISRHTIRSIESDRGSSSINALLNYSMSLGCVVIISPIPSIGVVKPEKITLKPQVNPFGKTNTILNDDDGN